MSLQIPFIFVGGVGNKARASEVNANFAAVAARFTEGPSGISDGDISASAAIKGTKISNLPGSRIPSDRIEDDAITFDKLKDDATAGSPNAAVNVAEHIKDGIITLAKLNAAVRFGKDRLKLTIYTVGFSVANGTGSTSTWGGAMFTVSGLPNPTTGCVYLAPYLTGVAFAGSAAMAVMLGDNSQLGTNPPNALLWFATSLAVGANMSGTINVPVIEAASV